MLGKTKTPVVPQVTCCVVVRGAGAVRAAGRHGARRFGCTAPSGPWLAVDTRGAVAKAPQNWAFFLAQLRHSEAWQWPVWNLARTALACSILLCRNMEKPSIKTTRMILFCRKDRLLKEPVPQGFLQLARIQSLNLKKQTSIPSGPAALSRGGF